MSGSSTTSDPPRNMREATVDFAVDQANAAAAMRAEIERLRDALAAADRVIHCIELTAEPWTAELMAARDAAITRHRERANAR